MKLPPPKPPLQEDDLRSLSDELDRKHRESEKALIEAIEDEPSRDSLLSISDIEDLTGNIAREAARGAVEGASPKSPSGIEVQGPLGFKLKGSLGRTLIIIMVSMIGYLIATYLKVKKVLLP